MTLLDQIKIHSDSGAKDGVSLQYGHILMSYSKTSRANRRKSSSIVNCLKQLEGHLLS